MIQGDHKLKGYYRALQAAGSIVVLIIAAFVYLFPTYFKFLGPTNTVIFLYLGIWVVHVTFIVLHEVSKKNIFFTLSRYSWVVFFAGLVLASGGLGSSIIYLFTFPILVAAVDLESKDVKRVATIIIVFLFSLFIFDKSADATTMFIHGFNILIFSVICYFAYKLSADKEAIHSNFDRLSAVERIKTDFITVASNRLRTPLTGVLYALTELSERGISSEADKKIVTEGLTHAKDANEIVNDLIHAIELDTYHLNILPEQVDVIKIVNNIVTSLDNLTKVKGTDVSLDMPTAISLKGNPNMLMLALSNIIDNAIRYSPKGKVSISVYESDNSCRVTVKDNGIGIKEKDIPLIFDRLYRGENAVHLEPNRSGIGMYAAKRIIELHKGSINIISKEGEGTTVTIVLPMV